MTIKDWVTNLPGALDTPATDQPDLINSTDVTRVSQIHTARDIAQYAAFQIGSNLEEAGTIRRRITSLETDTKLPWLACQNPFSITTYDISAAPGQPSTVKLTLQDKKQRSFTGTVTINLSISGEGGRATGVSEAASTPYAVYLVPKASDDAQLVARCDTSFSGPTGYTNYCYIGPICNDSSSNLIQVRQVGSEFYMDSQIQIDVIVPPTPPVDTNPVQISLPTWVPISALLVRFFGQIEQPVDSGWTAYYGPTDWTTKTPPYNMPYMMLYAKAAGGDYDAAIGYWEMTCPNLKFYRKFTKWFGTPTALVNYYLTILGWTDSYLV